MNITDVITTEVIAGCYIVEALVGRDWLVHEGPAKFDYFTREEAAALAARVRRAGAIDLTRWYSPLITHEELAGRWEAYAIEEHAAG